MKMKSMTPLVDVTVTLTEKEYEEIRTHVAAVTPEGTIGAALRVLANLRSAPYGSTTRPRLPEDVYRRLAYDEAEADLLDMVEAERPENNSVTHVTGAYPSAPPPR